MKLSRADAIRTRLDAVELALSARYHALDELWVKEVGDLKKRHSMQKEYECRALEEEQQELLEMLDREIELDEMAEGA